MNIRHSLNRAAMLFILVILATLAACGGGGGGTTGGGGGGTTGGGGGGSTAPKAWGTAGPISNSTDWIGATVDAPSPQIAFDLSGNAFAVWAQHDGTRFNIWSNRYTPGAGWSAAFPIESEVGDATHPQIAFDANGNALVVWEQFDGTNYNIMARRYAAGTGTTPGVWGLVARIDTSVGNALSPQLAFDLNGNALMVWEQYDGTRNNIWANRYSAVANAWDSTATLIESDNTGNAQSPQIAFDVDGNALAVWSQYYFDNYSNGAGNDTHYHIFSKRYTAITNAWEASAHIVSDPATNFASGTRAPQIAIDASGNALAVWYQYDGVRANVWTNRYAASSGTWGAATLLETDNQGYATNPQIAFDLAGNALAVWYQQDGLYYKVWANRYSVVTHAWEGAALIDPLSVGSVPPGFEDRGGDYDPQIAFDANGNAMVVWWRFTATDTTIVANRYTAGTGWGASEIIEADNEQHFARPAQIAVDADGNALAVWVQANGVNLYIAANRYE